MNFFERENKYKSGQNPVPTAYEILKGAAPTTLENEVLALDKCYKYTVIFKCSEFKYTTLYFKKRIHSFAGHAVNGWLKDETDNFVNLNEVRQIILEEEPDEVSE